MDIWVFFSVVVVFVNVVVVVKVVVVVIILVDIKDPQMPAQMQP